MAKKLAIFNFLSVILAIAVNYYTQAVELNGNTIGSLSADYENLFTPAGYAFSIWAVIYLALLAYSGFQIYCAFITGKHTELITKTGAWFILANIGNMAWVFAWLYELTGLSVVIMLFILFSLIKIILNTNMERWDAPLKVIAFSWWPICFYSGWIAVATIANISAYLAKIGWDGWFLSEVQWAATMIVVATILNIIMIYTRNMREFGLVGVWALVAIFVRHSRENEALAWIAMGGAILIFLNAGYHGYKNKETSPMAKLKNS
ncbi:tryptophan-rich sensory protein [Salegentibacter sp. F188]|uniref:Tryptophan-rich sensory protein n=1 Tax=Autumnicola patrickiae TaxID=3075591 RepID=A0ABU3E5B5_9FLAO|nr:tryptophan-rich sensory protein [Salegentibacter sp. F188]MDT0691191.1 tryptophan-rich sensory protein [Salegentibacter sp. F188]